MVSSVLTMVFGSLYSLLLELLHFTMFHYTFVIENRHGTESEMTGALLVLEDPILHSRHISRIPF